MMNNWVLHYENVYFYHLRRCCQRDCSLGDSESGAISMTVKELIEKLSEENPDALVYTMDNSDDIALIVTDVSRNILVGRDETVVIH